MLIIDAFNVLHTDGILPDHLNDLGVPGLIRLVSTSRYASRDVTIVCDGGGSTTESGIRMDAVRIIYSGNAREADDVIEDLIERFHRGNALEIVSSDKRLKRAARRKRARSTDSATFLQFLVTDADRPQTSRTHAMREQVPLDRYSVTAWLDEFGIEHTQPPTPQQDGTTGPQSRAMVTPAPDTSKAGRPRQKKSVPKATAGLGERLKVALPDQPPEAPQTVLSGPVKPQPTDSEATGRATPASTETPTNPRGSAPPAVDPLLRAALEEWRDRLSLDDLDMQQWVPDAIPHPKQPPRSP